MNDVLAKVDGDDFNCPGSTLQVEMNMDSPLTFGMQSQEAIYFADSPAFQTRVPDPRFERTVIARYPDDDKDILISGYLEGGELLEKRAAVVEIEVGKGRVILIGFRAQHRAQPVRTFKLLFNTLYKLRRPDRSDVRIGLGPPSSISLADGRLVRLSVFLDLRMVLMADVNLSGRSRSFGHRNRIRLY